MNELPEPSIFEREGVRGFLHRPSGQEVAALVLAHGAGGSCDSKLLRAMAAGFAAHGLLVLRFDLPFRQRRASGPPHPSTAVQDRFGIEAAAEAVRELASGPLLIGGHSYGGRQSSMLAAEQPTLAEGLVLLSYPLHPPGRPERLRIEHLPELRTPAVFAHGSKDPFGTLDEMRAAVALIPAPHRLIEVPRAGHDLGRTTTTVVERTVEVASELFDLAPN